MPFKNDFIFLPSLFSAYSGGIVQSILLSINKGFKPAKEQLHILGFIINIETDEPCQASFYFSDQKLQWQIIIDKNC